MTYPSTIQGLALASAAAALVGACTTLLGNDFVIESGAAGGGASGGTGGTTSTSSGGGSGGDGGASGGGGTAPALPYQCNWVLPTHVRVASLQNSPDDDWRSELLIENSGHNARVVAQRETMGAQPQLELYTLDDNNVQYSSWQAHDAHAIARRGSNAVAVLYSTRNVQPPFITLNLRVIDDNDGNGADAGNVPLTSAQAFGDMGSSVQNFNADFAVHPGSNTVDFYASYPNTNGAYVETFGRYTGNAPVAPVGINLASDLIEEDVNPFAMVARDNQSFVFLGDPSSLKGPRQYALDETVVGPVAARTLGAPGELVLDVLMQPDAVNVAAAEIGTDVSDPLLLMAEGIDPSTLASFAIADLTVAAEYATVANLPVGDTFMGWVADILILMGGTAMAQDQLTFVFFDSLGRDRGTGTLPFQGPLETGEQRLTVDRVAVSARDEFFHTMGGNLHVVWTENHHVGNPSEAFKVMYYDQLGCYPVE